MTSTIAILPGSVRPEGNNAGLVSWVSHHLSKVLSSSSPSTQILPLNSSNSPLPLGPILDPIIAAGHTRSDPSPHYSSPATRQWSSLVRTFSALIIITPQYNRGYPGELKNTLDHLYFEWRNMPVLIITYGGGGHGGGKCMKQLKEVCEDGFKMRLVGNGEGEEVCVTLPDGFIRENERVGKEEPFPEFLKEYEEGLEKALKKLVEATENTSA